MNSVHQMRSRLAESLPLFVIALFVIQPLMDVLSYWLAELQMSNTLTLVLRLLVLAVTVLAGFCLSRKKRVYFIAAAVCAVVGVGHILACWQFGYQNIVTDLSNYVRVIQMPLTVICLITYMKENEKCYEAIQKGLAINLAIILLVQILAIITGTEPHTYFDGTGYIGWFSNTNSQSAILCMTAPAAVVWLYQRKGLKNLWFWLILVGSCLSMFYFGTRLAYMGIVAMCFGLMVSMVVIKLKNWKSALAMLAVGVVFIAMFPLSPMEQHRDYWREAQEEKQGWIDVDLTRPVATPTPTPTPTPSAAPSEETTETPALTEEEKHALLIAKLMPIYERHLKDYIAIFGAERTMEMFDYTTDITQLTATRPKKLLFAQELMKDSPALSRFFGIELTRFTVNGSIYDVENDFHGIYYLYGAVGLGALLLFLAYFLWLIVKALIKNFRRYFTLEAAAWGIALIMCLAHCYFTAGVLRRPNASFYMSVVLAAVFYLVKLKKYPDEIEV